MLNLNILKIISSLQLLRKDSNKGNSESQVLLKKPILAFIRLSANITFHCHNSKGLKVITRLRLKLSHLRFHKFEHSFQDKLNPICNYGVMVLFKQLFTTFLIVLVI